MTIGFLISIVDCVIIKVAQRSRTDKKNTFCIAVIILGTSFKKVKACDLNPEIFFWINKNFQSHPSYVYFLTNTIYRKRIVTVQKLAFSMEKAVFRDSEPNIMV